MLKTHARKKHLSFHTPGHKRAKWDITELSYSDNLSAPKGCIAHAEKDISKILGSAKSFILTDGSTSGVLSMLLVAKKTDVKTLAVPANSHKSVFNGSALLQLSLVVYDDTATEAFQIVENATRALTNADALFVTSPTYYGVIPPLQSLRTLCDTQRKLLLIDGAHGGHLHFDKRLYAGAFADLWVDGVHKSLPARTQGAVVSAKTEALGEILFESVNAFRTSSPSYPIMASVEYAVKYPENEPLERAVRDFACRYETRVTVNQDWTKLIAHFDKNAFTVEKALEKRGIYPEFCDGKSIVFYLSPATKFCAFRRLTRTLKKLFIQYETDAQAGVETGMETGVEEINKESVCLNPAPVLLKKDDQAVWVDIDEAVGKICAENCGLFPPCTPLIFQGEVVKKEKTELLKQANNAFGVKDNKILVYVGEKDKE